MILEVLSLAACRQVGEIGVDSDRHELQVDDVSAAAAAADADTDDDGEVQIPAAGSLDYLNAQVDLHPLASVGC